MSTATHHVSKPQRPTAHGVSWRCRSCTSAKQLTAYAFQVSTTIYQQNRTPIKRCKYRSLRTHYPTITRLQRLTGRPRAQEDRLSACPPVPMIISAIKHLAEISPTDPNARLWTGPNNSDWLTRCKAFAQKDRIIGIWLDWLTYWLTDYSFSLQRTDQHSVRMVKESCH